MLNALKKKATPKNIKRGLLAILIINLVIFPSFPFIFSAPDFNLLEIPDLKFGYTFDDVNSILSDMGAQGRKAYFISTAVIDNLYALIYGWIYASIILALLKSNNIYHQFKALVAIPFLISLFDWLENASTLYYIKTFPNTSDNFFLTLESLPNQLKWIFALLTAVVIFVLLLLKLINTKQ